MHPTSFIFVFSQMNLHSFSIAWYMFVEPYVCRIPYNLEAAPLHIIEGPRYKSEISWTKQATAI
jgi:hypothetical protein